MAVQDNWRFCGKCQGLAFGGNGQAGTCPLGGKHNHDVSFNYKLTHDTGGDQQGWRFCSKCFGLVFGLNSSPKPCPAGGQHALTISFDYILSHDSTTAPGQHGWRFCQKCQGLAFGLNPTSPGACPAGGHHDHSVSFDYILENDIDGGVTFFPIDAFKSDKVQTGLHVDTHVRLSNTGSLDGTTTLTNEVTIQGFHAGAVILLVDGAGNLVHNAGLFRIGVNPAGLNPPEKVTLSIHADIPPGKTQATKRLEIINGHFPKDVAALINSALATLKLVADAVATVLKIAAS